MLRGTLIGLSIAALVVVGALFVSGHQGLVPVLAWVAVQASILAIAIVAERGRYRPSVTTASGWVRTDERFLDPTSREWVAVDFNPSTGERRYVPLAQSSETVPPSF